MEDDVKKVKKVRPIIDSVTLYCKLTSMLTLLTSASQTRRV